VELHVSLVGRKDLSGDIYSQLRQAILDGRLRPGDRLPPTPPEGAGAAPVRSRAQPAVAYDRLWNDGFVTARDGAGTFVSGDVLSARGRARRPPSDGLLRLRAVSTRSNHAGPGSA
jgi:GntR family transcriptional regulator/MocR family aminotransferase